MKLLSVGTILKIKDKTGYYKREYEDIYTFIQLNKRRKIKKKHGCDFEYIADIYILRNDECKQKTDQTISFHYLRTMMQNKEPNAVKRITNGELQIEIAKTLLMS